MTHFKKPAVRMRRLLLATTAAMITASSGACTLRDGTGHGVVAVVARDYGFEIEDPEGIRPGITELELRNEGEEAHQLSLARLKDGVDAAQFALALTGTGHGNPVELVEFIGGPNHVAPGKTEVSYVELYPGEYVMICFIPSHDGVPHLAKGMMASFRVSGDRSLAVAPTPDEHVKLTDYGITMAAEIDGDAVLEVENAGAEPHELALLELDGSMTAEEALAQLVSDHAAGNKPTTTIPVAGGAAMVSPGRTTLAKVDLKAGRYLAVCYAPTPDGTPHFELGMTKEVRVR
jgi:uncharacterized cupredoxin-like copper-binding protein